jgi:Subtilase family
LKAILWAISNKVDIISISWTISRLSDTGMAPELTAAIQKAVGHGILVFCSISDQVPTITGLLPASCSDDLFRIGAATLSGQVWRWNGAKEVNYILPGTDLEVKIGDEPFDDRLEHICESGSSLATALASGLAALILECLALSDAGKLQCMKGKRAQAKMRTAFANINRGVADLHDKRYLRVWATFGQALKDEKKEDKVKLQSVVDRLMIGVKEEGGPEEQREISSS